MRKLIALLAAVGMSALAILVPTQHAQGQTAQLHCCTGNPAPTPTPPVFTGLLSYSYASVGGTCSANLCGKMPTNSQTVNSFWYGVETQSSLKSTSDTLIALCTGRTQAPKNPTATGSNCQFYAYDGVNQVLCPSPVGSSPSENAWNYAIANGQDEAFALHWSAASGNGDGLGDLVAANREVVAGESGTCSANGGANSPGSGNDLATNAQDGPTVACMRTYLLTTTANAGCGTNWTTTGPWLDTASGGGVSWDYWWWNNANVGWQSAENGNTVQFVTGQNTHHNPVSYIAGFATFVNTLQPIHIVAKAPANGADFCGTTTIPAGAVTAGCYPTSYSFAGGSFNNATVDSVFCNALTQGNFDGFLQENSVDRSVTTGNVIVNILNTIYSDEANSACTGIKQVIEEENDQYFSELLGVIWLAPDPATGAPDVIIPWRTPQNTNAINAVPYWVDYGLDPQGPEQATNPYSFNGTTASLSSWCQSASVNQPPNGISGDSGGVQPFVVDCPAKNFPVYVVQYRHSYTVDGVDHGPVAAVVNTSSSAVTIPNPATLWFGSLAPGNGDPASTYSHVITFAQCVAPSGTITVGPGTGYSGHAGDTVTVTINGHPLTYTLLSGDASSATTLATDIAAAINADGTDAPIVTATSSGRVVTVTSDSTGLAFQYIMTVSQTGTGNETYTLSANQLLGTTCEGAYIPSGYAGGLLTALQDINTNCTDAQCYSGSASTAINFTSTSFIPGTTSVPANSTIILGP